MLSMGSLMLCLVVAASPVQPSPTSADVIWSGDPARSNVTLSVSEFFFSHVTGNMPIATATIETTTDAAAPISIQADLNAASLDTHNRSRDAELRGDHFFDTTRYPTIAFASQRITATSPERYAIDGTLTMRGVTRPLRLDARLVNVGPGADGVPRVRYEATGHFHRSDYGMTYVRGIVGNDVALRIVLEAKQQRQ